jgi:serine/threonine protein kinase
LFFQCAPEVILRKPYTEAVDNWSLGVLTYILLSGYHPFDVYGEMPEPELLQKIITCSYDFDDPVWEQCSEEAKSLIRGCLQLDPAKRISLSSFLSSPWITGEKAASAVPLPIVADRLSKFATTRNGFRTLVVAKLASNKFKASLSRSSVIRVASLTQTAQNPQPFAERSAKGTTDGDLNGNGSENSLTDEFQSQFIFQSPGDSTESRTGNANPNPNELSMSRKAGNSVSRSNQQDQSAAAPALTITINPDLGASGGRPASPLETFFDILSVPVSPSANTGSISANKLDLEVREVGPDSGIYIDKNGKQKGGLGNAIPETEADENISAVVSLSAH